jgi:hypothetical protein
MGYGVIPLLDVAEDISMKKERRVEENRYLEKDHFGILFSVKSKLVFTYYIQAGARIIYPFTTTKHSSHTNEGAYHYFLDSGRSYLFKSEVRNAKVPRLIVARKLLNWPASVDSPCGGIDRHFCVYEFLAITANSS